MTINGAMKLPADDLDLSDDQFYDDDEAFFAKSNVNRQSLNPVVDCCVTAIASLQFLWFYRRLEFILAFVLLLSITLAITGVIESYEMKKHSFKRHYFSHEYADIKSALELKLGDIDHWCLDGSDNTCAQCDDPTHPTSRGEYAGWRQAFMRNVKLSRDFAGNGVQPDIIFLGDSLIEATVGTFKGIEGLDGSPAADQLDSIKALYDKKFKKINGGKYDALRLGIAGDTSPNLFWRIKQNEMRNLTPQVWWVAIGRNDLFRTQCSEEVTLMGIIRVVEELISRNDGATVVINSILPTAEKATMQLEGHHARNDMWKSIKEVNSRLKKFAQKHHHVLFYDANDVFVEERMRRKYITKSLYADKAHPSLAGYQALVKNQMEFLNDLMVKRLNSQSNDAMNNQAESTNNSNSNTQNSSSETQNSLESGLGFDDDYYRTNNYLSFPEDDFLADFNLYDDAAQEDDW